MSRGIHGAGRSHSVSRGPCGLCGSRVGAAGGAGGGLCGFVRRGARRLWRCGPRPMRSGSGAQHRLTGEVRLLIAEQVSDPAGRAVRSYAACGQGADSGGGAGSGGAAGRGAAGARHCGMAGADEGAAGAARRQAATGWSELSAGLTGSLRPLAETIERKILPDGSLADDASPELSRLRREQERQQRVIEEIAAGGAAQARRARARRRRN